MPTYEYQCESCEHRFEIFQRITEEPIKKCEKCGGPVHKIIFPVGIMFKGSGFHVNDYPKNGKVESSSDKSKTTSDT